jgi:fumarate reductase subunit D
MKKIAYSISAFVFPLFAFAQVNSFQDLGNFVISIINGLLVPLIFALAFIVFIFGVFRYFIMGGHDEEKRESGKNLIFYGLIGFFVMVSVWGLVHILTGTIGLTNNVPTYPTAPRTTY